jgi:hypothetical protein
MNFNITAHFDGDHTPSQDAVITAANLDAARTVARDMWPDAAVWLTQPAQ